MSPAASRSRLPFVLLGVVLAVAVVGIVAASLLADPEAPEEAQAQLEAAATDPQARYGERVTVGGEVTERARRAFVLTARDRSLLVVPQDPGLAGDVNLGEAVVASGTLVEVPEGQGILGEDDIFDRWGGRPSVEAQQVRLVE